MNLVFTFGFKITFIGYCALFFPATTAEANTNDAYNLSGIHNGTIYAEQSHRQNKFRKKVKSINNCNNTKYQYVIGLSNGYFDFLQSSTSDK